MMKAWFFPYRLTRPVLSAIAAELRRVVAAVVL